MILVSSAIPQYLDALRLAKKSNNTIKTYTHALRRFTGIVGEEAPLDGETFKTFLQVIARETDVAQLTYRVPVARVYRYYAPEIPVDTLIEQFGQERKKRFIQYNEEGVERLISYAETLRGDLLALRDRAFILSLADTGLRIFEACNLSRGDLDFDRKRALITGKGDKPGIIRFSSRSLEAIKDYLSMRAELDGSSGRPLGTLPLFARHDPGAGKKVKRVKPGGMSYSLALRAREAGISEEDELERGEVTAHKLRHRFVTMILRVTKNPAVAQILARHEDINTTMRYGHLAESEIDRVYRDIFYK